MFFEKKALVIGGSGGIGSAICRELSKHNCTLTIHGGHESDSFEKFVSEMSDAVPTKKIVQYLDVGFAKTFSNSTLNKSVKDADIICVCYGPFLQQKLHEMDSQSWEKMIELNLLLPALVISSALPQMMEKKWGRFLLIGGTRTERVNAFATNAAYASSKTALSTLVRSTALEYAKYGITCNALFPGFTKTEYLREDICDILSSKMPQKRLIEATEVAETAINVLKQPMVNGSLISIDGGWDPAF